MSALAAYPLGRRGDRFSKLGILIAGYGLGVLTNGFLAFGSSSLLVVVAAIAFSGITIAAEETLERAVASEILARGVRSLGLGLLACANAIGDMLSSLYVGLELDRGRPTWAFGAPVLVGVLGIAWMVALHRSPGSRERAA